MLFTPEVIEHETDLALLQIVLKVDKDKEYMLDKTTAKRGKQYNPLESRKPSSNVSLET